MKRLFIYFLTVCLTALSLSACRPAGQQQETQETLPAVGQTEPETTKADSPEVLYRAEELPFDCPVENIDQVCVSGRRIGLIGWNTDEEKLRDYRLVLITADGQTQELALPLPAAAFVKRAALGEECVWVVTEAISFGDDAGMIQTLTATGLDGTLRYQIPLPAASEDREPEVTGMQADRNGDLWMMEKSAQEILCVAEDGTVKCRLDARAKGVWGIAAGSDGSVFGWGNSPDGSKLLLFPVDSAEGTWKEPLVVETKADAIYPGLTGEFLFTEGDRLKEYFPAAETLSDLLSFSEAGIVADDVSGIAAGDGEGMLVFCDGSGSAQHRLLRLNREALSLEELQKSQIVIASLTAGEDLRQFVTAFNQSGSRYQVQIKEYASGSGQELGAEEALERLNADLADGTAGDLLDLAGLKPYVSRKQYVKMGVLEDIYPWIDRDPSIDRQDFCAEIWKANEIDGGLYNLVPIYQIDTVFGRVSRMGDRYQMTMEELLEYEPSVLVYGVEYTWQKFLYEFSVFYLEDGEPEKAGTILANDVLMQGVLTFAAALPEEVSAEVSEIEDLHSGAQQMVSTSTPFTRGMGRNLIYYPYEEAIMGEALTTVGYPADDEIGSSFTNLVSLGLCAASQKKEGAWEFLKFTLSEKGQNLPSNHYAVPTKYNMPVLRSVWEESCRALIGQEDYTPWEYGNDKWMVAIPPATAETVAAAEKLVSQITRIDETDPKLYQILEEEAGRYIHGECTLQETLETIRGRAGVYLNEKQ